MPVTHQLTKMECACAVAPGIISKLLPWKLIWNVHTNEHTVDPTACNSTACRMKCANDFAVGMISELLQWMLLYHEYTTEPTACDSIACKMVLTHGAIAAQLAKINQRVNSVSDSSRGTTVMYQLRFTMQSVPPT